MEITNIKLENYKCIGSLETPAWHKTLVSGKNASGKSTVADAIFDVLCDKMSDGTAPNNIRPHDANGCVTHNVPIVREITATIDGTPYTITKVTEEKWRKPHGSTELVFDGNKTTFKIDGFEKQLKDYNEWLESHIAKQNMIAFYMNPQVFLNSLGKSTTEARKVLEKVSGFSVNDFVKVHEEYSEIAKLIGENQIEDVLKQYRRELKNQKDALNTAMKNLEYEKNREITLLEVNEEELKQLTEDKAKCDKELSDIQSSITELKNARQELQYELDDIKEENSKGLFEAIRNADIETGKALKELNFAQSTKAMLKSDIDNAKDSIKEMQSTMERYQAEANKNTCPTCGRKLPENAIEEKVKKYSDAISKLTFSVSEKEKLIAEKEAELHEIEAKIPMLEHTHKVCNETALRISKTKVEHENNAEYVKVYNGIKNIDEKLNNFESSMVSTVNLVNELSKKIYKIESDKKSNDDAQNSKKYMISKLSDKVKEEASRCSEIERKIDTIQEFSIKKNEALADKINPYFNHFYFEFIEYTELEHNPVETCRLIEKETHTDYMNGLNHGSKIVCEAELVAGFQKMNNVSLPIILDDSESVDTDRIPKVEQQLFVLRREDNKQLTVEEMK